MINPGTLLDNIVTQLRLVSDLVIEMGGDADRIAPYYDQYPDSTSVTRAIADMSAPGILVVWDGTAQGGGQMQPWTHQFRLIVKLGEKVAASNGTDRYAALLLLVEGIPTGATLPLKNLEINSGCDGMVLPPRFERQSLIIDQQGNQMDFWVCRYTLTEKGA